MNTKLISLCATSTALVVLSGAAGAQDAAPPETADADREIVEVTVVGSRGKPRTDVERPVPVDVVSAEDLQQTGQTDLGQQVQFTSPSFNSAKYGINGTTNYADPATLRGLSPDQVLVLVNGKRRHQFSAINLNVAPGLGNVVTDLNSLPSAAVKRIEVLRDGAAAQYGSDAIAGIINLALQDGSDGGTFALSGGVHSEGDGETYKGSLNHGLPLGGNGGFFNYTLEAFSFEGTNRSDPYTGPIYPATPANYATTGPTPDFPYTTANPRADRGVYPLTPFIVGNYGANKNETYQGFINASIPISEAANFYAFGGYSEKRIRAFGFYRAPSVRANAVLSIYPDGYVPVLPGVSTDYSLTGGFALETGGGWKYDFSVGYGHNDLDLEALNTVNASIGATSPTNFYVGNTEFNQTIVDATVSKDLGEVGFLGELNMAAGLQYRRDNFVIERGSLESYLVGPLAATQNRAPGSNARPGYAPEDENDLSRNNFGAFVDFEADVTEAFLLAAALRFEDYSDFGSNISGKLATRYKITDGFGVRASYNRGFRAPSLQQIGSRVNTSTVQNGLIQQTQQISSDDPRLAQLGIDEPEAETSDSFNIGITAESDDFLGGKVSLTLDAFQIDISDRIVISEGILAANYPAVRALFPAPIREIRFFTNQVETKTQGVDLVGTYKLTFANSSSLDFTLAGTISKTQVESQDPTPAQILAGAAPQFQGIRLLGQTAIELIEVAQPRTKILLSTNYRWNQWGFGLRLSHFGNVKAFSTGLSPLDSNVECDAANRCVQTFAEKTLTDISVNYEFNDNISLSLVGNNIFDVYPDKYNNLAEGFVGQAGSYADGQVPYSRNSNQFGFNGAFYQLSANFKF
jgi:iron complex outermembrane recepter protein